MSKYVINRAGTPGAPPVPTKVRAAGRPALYPLQDLGVGDSFLVPNSDIQHPQTVRNTLYSRAKELGVRVTTAREPEGLRVWRVS